MKEIKIKQMIRISHVLAVQLIAPNEKNMPHIETHCKQHLNELHLINQLSKNLSNETGKTLFS